MDTYAMRIAYVLNLTNKVAVFPEIYAERHCRRLLRCPRRHRRQNSRIQIWKDSAKGVQIMARVNQVGMGRGP
jgi:hypothetical protein